MKKIILGVAAAALTLGAGAAAAQPYGGRGYDRGYERSYDRSDYGRGYGRGDYGRGYRDSDRDGRPDHREWNRDRDRDGRPDQYDRNDRRRDGARAHYRGGHRWRQGEVYPYWRESRYVVHDYRAYRLPPPRHGYRYYRSDNGDVVMAAIASGVIGAIIGSALD